MSEDYVPTKDEEFDHWVGNLVTKSDDLSGPLNIPASAMTTVLGQYATWHGVWILFLDPAHSAVDTQNKNDARIVMEAAIRAFVKLYLINNPALTNGNKVDLGLPIYSTTNTPAEDPTTIPLVWKIDSGIIRRLGVYYKDSVGKSRAKPKHVHGAQINGALLDHYPTSIDELYEAYFNTASPFIRIFAEEGRGKTYYFILRWENNKAGNGKGVGDWGEIHSAIVP
jgi:hypothetical protein